MGRNTGLFPVHESPICDVIPALPDALHACILCAERFATTATTDHPRQVVWFAQSARLLITRQAPGMRVHLSGRPFDDAFGGSAARLAGAERSAVAPLIRDVSFGALMADKAFDANGLLEELDERGASAVIKSKATEVVLDF